MAQRLKSLEKSEQTLRFLRKELERLRDNYDHLQRDVKKVRHDEMRVGFEQVVNENRERLDETLSKAKEVTGSFAKKAVNPFDWMKRRKGSDRVAVLEMDPELSDAKGRSVNEEGIRPSQEEERPKKSFFKKLFRK